MSRRNSIKGERRDEVVSQFMLLPKRETRRFTPDDRERTEQVYDYGTHIISETLGDPWDGRLPDHQREAILQRIDRAVSRYWQHPFRRAQDGNDHPIDPKTGEIIIKN